MPVDPVAEQRAFYAAVADEYDVRFVAGDDAHAVALARIAEETRRLGARSVLDCGCGTGRALAALATAAPALERLAGVDPSRELLARAAARPELAAAELHERGGEALPFGDGELDVVVATGVLHHVPDPTAVVRELCRVAGRAVFLSDINMYGHGSLPGGVAKLALARAGLLRPINRARRGGVDWFASLDGVAWSYSLRDDLRTVRDAMGEVEVVPTAGRRGARRLPLLRASHWLLVGRRPG